MTSSELDRFKHILATIALTHPDLGLSEALLLAQDTEEQMKSLPLDTVTNVAPDWDDLDAAAAYVKHHPKVRVFYPDKKINGIKAIRAMSSLGLKEAKEVWELAFDGTRPPPPF